MPIDPTPEIKTIVGDLIMQLAVLQATVRRLEQDNAALRARLSEGDPSPS